MTRRSEPAFDSSPARVLVIGGPTGSGKNLRAMEIAREFPSEIVNADSRQVYRELSIGTNQPPPGDQLAVPHHLFGFLPPAEAFNAADYARLAFPLIERITERGKLAIVVGGTGFYIRALLKGTWDVPPKDPQLRSRLRGIADRREAQHVHRLLRRLDPEAAAGIAPNDIYRVIRALEIRLQSGKRRSQVAAERPDRISTLRFFVNPDRATLRQQIQDRTRLMFRSGWVEEVRHLMESYPDFPRYPAARSLGYPEIISHLQHRLSLEECFAAIVTKTNQYAKRQTTWFRNQDGFIPVFPDENVFQRLDSVLKWKR